MKRLKVCPTIFRHLRLVPFVIALVCLRLTVPYAQTPEQVANAIKPLSSSSRAVIERLFALKQLPPPTWKFHVGDMPHGEAIALDDRDWEVARPRSEFPPGSEIPEHQYTWYRASIEIPKTRLGYDLSGCRIWFQFIVSGDAVVPEIVYFNGRRVAMGEDLEPIVLVEDAKPGERILVAVKVTEPNGVKLHFGRSALKVEFPASRPNPNDLAQQSLAAAVLTDGSASSAEKTQLEKAISTVDLQALDDGDQQRFDRSLQRAQLELAPLRAALQKFTFILSGNSHIDAAWLWPWTETVEAVRRTFGTATQLMQEYPDYTFTQSTAQYSEWIADKYPYINDQIKRRIKEDRWEIVGGMWVEPDLNMPDGESLARQLLVGKRFFKEQYGVDVRIGWNPDSFGYNWQLPQIYKKSGIDYFVTAKLTYNETHKMPFKLFWWQAPDGSKVLTYLPRQYDSLELNPGRIAAEVAPVLKTAPGMAEVMDLFGVGDHGGGPSRVMLDEGRRWMGPNKIAPKMKFGTAQSYFTDIEQKLAAPSPRWNYRSLASGYTPPPAAPSGQISIPTWNDELYFEFHRGVLTTQANHKRNLRESEERMLNGEKYASLAWLAGEAYPHRELTESWKKVLFNEFHDLAAGSGIGVLYREAQKDYDQVRWATNEISTKALNTIAAAVDTRGKGEVPILVFNPLSWPRSGLVDVEVQYPSASTGQVAILDSQGQVVPAEVLAREQRRNTYKLRLYVKDVPALGYKVLQVVSGARQFVSDLQVNGFTLENSALRVTVDPHTGYLTSLYDKKAQFEALAADGAGNQLQTFADNPKCCDAWNIDPGTLDHPNVLAKVDAVEVINRGPLAATIRVTRSWQNSKFVQDITLYAGLDQLEVVNDIDWNEKHQLLKVAFPLAASSNNATFEIPYGTIERPTTRNNSWEQTRFEVAALRWADLGDTRHGLSLINEAKYGYDAKDNVLRLSLLRSATSPDPTADQGRQHFSYVLYPHAGDWKQALTMRRGYEYNYKLTAMQVAPHAGSLPSEYSYLSVQPENVVLTALKKAEDADGLILHLFEWAGRKGEVQIKLPPGATAATITNLMEKPEGAKLVVSDDTIKVRIRPYEILCLRVDYANR